jgi:hypothetical protein
MTDLNDLPPGGQAQAAWARPTRSKAERRAHVLRRLASENKLWIATAAADGGAHLVPFSFVWDGERLSMATAQDNPAARNAARTGKARLALGNISDIVLIDGAIRVIALHALDDALAERLSLVSAIDARQAPGYIYLRLTPDTHPGLAVCRRTRAADDNARWALARPMTGRPMTGRPTQPVISASTTTGVRGFSPARPSALRGHRMRSNATVLAPLYSRRRLSMTAMAMSQPNWYPRPS